MLLAVQIAAGVGVCAGAALLADVPLLTAKARASGATTSAVLTVAVVARCTTLVVRAAGTSLLATVVAGFAGMVLPARLLLAARAAVAASAA